MALLFYNLFCNEQLNKSETEVASHTCTNEQN